MSFLNHYKKSVSVLAAVGFLVVGLILAVVAGVSFAAPERETETVVATIVDITSFGTGEDATHDVTVSYEVAGANYVAVLGAYQSGWRVGDTLECKVEVGHPENISYGDGKMLRLIVLVAGILAAGAGGVMLVKALKRPAADYSQYDRVHEADPTKVAEIEQSDEALAFYVFHFTGKLNQSYVMKDEQGQVVYRADCGGIKLVGATEYDFVNYLTGSHSAKKIGHTVTTTVSNFAMPFPSTTSAFRIDGVSCWDVLAGMGYGFSFSLEGIKSRFDVKRYGVPVGTVELAGTDAMNEKYEGNPLAKIPTNGIYRIQCRPSEVEGFFYVCFCLTKTDFCLD